MAWLATHISKGGVEVHASPEGGMLWRLRPQSVDGYGLLCGVAELSALFEKAQDRAMVSLPLAAVKEIRHALSDFGLEQLVSFLDIAIEANDRKG